MTPLRTLRRPRRPAGSRSSAIRLALLLLLAVAVGLAGAILTPGSPPRPAEATTPAVTQLRITSDPGAKGYYATGDRIIFEVTFDTVITTWNSRYNTFWGSQALNTATRFAIQVGSATQYAYAEDHGSGNGDMVVLFYHDVVVADHDADGISVPTTSTILNNVTHVDSGTDHTAINRALPDNLDAAQAAHKVNTADYDADDDDLIEITTLAQLNAVRHDLDGNGSPSSGNETAYKTAFVGAGADMGCASGAGMCAGYELDADLDFAGSITFTNWSPIGSGFAQSTSFSGQFNGRGHTISNLPITTTSGYVGLFANVRGHIEQVGLVDVNIAVNRASGDTNAGALVGLVRDGGTVRYSYATGDLNITAAAAAGRTRAGGLIGEMAHTSQLVGSWAGVNVTVDSAATSGFDNVTGLVGGVNNGTAVSITACYAIGAVRTTRNSTDSAGLTGWITGGTTLSYSYSIAAVSHSGTSTTIGGAVGGVHAAATLTQVYWDNQASGIPTDNYGTGYSTSALQSPTAYGAAAGDAYFGWNIDLDNADGDNDLTTNTAAGEDANGDDPWDFGTNEQYPVLKFNYDADAIALQRTRLAIINYDTDGDNLIEVRTLAQLNAIRYDLDGNGGVSASDQANYTAAFPNPAAGMGCASGAGNCDGYELMADLDFAGSDYGSGVGWTPIGVDNSSNGATPYTAAFDGNHHTISNLTIASTGSNWAGLFAWLESPAVVSRVGLVDANVTPSFSSSNGRYFAVGTLSGYSDGTVRYCYATGTVHPSASGSGPYTYTGGLIGRVGNGGVVAASWANVAVTISSTSTNSAWDYAGGLLGRVHGVSANRTAVIASYARGSANSDRDNSRVGGLTGRMDVGTVTASYSTGAPSSAGASTVVGGLIGQINSNATVQYSYWDAETSGILDDTDSNAPEGEPTADLTTPEEYGSTGSIYENWNVNVDGDTGTGTPTIGGDDPWHFGADNQYPVLKFGYDVVGFTRQRGYWTPVDYDANGNGLIDIRTLAQLDAIRWDLNGDGVVAVANEAAYATAYPGLTHDMGCPVDCRGYELLNDLDFDTDGDGSTHTAGVGDADDQYYNGGMGWARIGACCAGGYNATFDGNGYVIANLFFNRPNAPDDYGLFGGIWGNSHITRLGLPNAYVAGRDYVGALTGDTRTRGRVSFCWATGQASGRDVVGMLIGINHGPVYSSWASGEVTASRQYAGGLSGASDGSLIATYSHADVTVGTQTAGSLTGQIENITDPGLGATRISASYATGMVSGSTTQIGGLAYVHGSANASDITDSYYDAATTGISGGATTANLQGTLGYTGIYENWRVDVDLDSNPDDPWDFGAANQYPMLDYGHSAASIAAQRALQDTSLRIVPPANVDRLLQTGADAYRLEVEPAVDVVALPATAYPTTQPDATAEITAVTPAHPTQPWAMGDTDIRLLPDQSETPTVVTLRVTAPLGRSVRDYTLTIQRVFCPKAQLTGPADVVGEGGSADFTVLVCGDTTEAVVVSWAVDADASTAEAADVGRALTGNITVPAGTDRESVLSFPITDDAKPEGSETLTVAITGVSGGTERFDDTAQTAMIALSDPSLMLRAPEGTGTGGAGDNADTPLTASSMLVITEGAARAYSIRLASDPGERVTVVIHSNHASITTSPPTVTFDAGNWQQPQRVTVNAAPDGDDKHERARLTHILTDADGGLLEIIDRVGVFVADVDPPDDDDDVCR